MFAYVNWLMNNLTKNPARTFEWFVVWFCPQQGLNTGCAFIYYWCSFVVKKKPLRIIISPYFSRHLAYNWFSGYIHLPNFEMHCIFPHHVPEERVEFQRLIQSLIHELMHKWLHENINLFASRKWDNIDKKEVYVYSAI